MDEPYTSLSGVLRQASLAQVVEGEALAVQISRLRDGPKRGRLRGGGFCSTSGFRRPAKSSPVRVPEIRAKRTAYLCFW